MTFAALALVLTAAVLHAVWNFAAKRTRSGFPVVFATSLVIAPCYVVVVVIHLTWWSPATFPWQHAWVIVVSGLLKTGYALFLQRAYRKGDLSLVYPLARGTGPLLAVTAAVLFLGEKLTPGAACGTLLIVGSIAALGGGARPWRAEHAHVLPGVAYGTATGVFIATYTVWDAHAVTGRGIPPVLFDAGTAWTVLLLLTPMGVRRWPEVAEIWRTKRVEVLTIAFLSPLAYVLVLTALSFTEVKYVAPVREVSMLLAAFLGARLLGEQHMRRRLVAAAGMAAGVMLLALD